MKGDYSKGKIYKIVCDTTKLVYIGSTCQEYLCKRLAAHRRGFVTWKEGRTSFVTSYKVLENNNYSIVLLELVNCQTKDELVARERFHIEANDCVNKQHPSRTRTEYYQDNKEKIIEKVKQYYQDNKEKKKEYRDSIKEKQNAKCACECGGKFSFQNKSTHLKSQKHLNYLK